MRRPSLALLLLLLPLAALAQSPAALLPPASPPRRRPPTSMPATPGRSTATSARSRTESRPLSAMSSC